MASTFHDLLDEKKDPVVEEYIHIIGQGLPKTTKAKTIAIVGAGVAGLVSARILPLYVCGEAYSDTQTWVEGALQTAELVLQQHFQLPPPEWISG